MSAPARPIDRLLAVMARLRDPRTGCPWDLGQTFATIAPYTIEEAHEVADAIARGDLECLRDELGDLLFQVVFHARLAEEAGAFSFDEVAAAVEAKLVRRHPHVFAADAGAKSAAAVRVSWEAQKAAERTARGDAATLADVPLGLPALVRGSKLGRRAARVGFDFSDAAAVRPKVDEELRELDAAIAGGDPRQVEAELGDLLFAVVNWARHLEVDAEAALRGANHRFERRFAHMERLAAARGLRLDQLDAPAWDALWVEAKRLDAPAA